MCSIGSASASSADQYSRSIFRSGSRRPAIVMTVSAASAPSRSSGGRPKNSIASGISAVSSSRLASSLASSSSSAGRQAHDVVEGGRLLGRHLADGVPEQRRGGRLAGHLRRHQHRADVLDEHPALGPGVGDRDLELPVAAGAGGELGAQRGRDQRVRRQRALLRAGQVEHPGVRPQLRHRAQPGQRAGRVEQGHLDAAAGGQVAERAEQRRLATAGLGDEHREAGALPDLHREVQVEEDRPAAGAGGAADQVAAPVADRGRGLRQRGGEQLDRHPAQVAGVGDRLAGDELAGQPVLVLRVLQRDPQLPRVELDEPAGPLQALLAGAAADRDAVPAVRPGGVDRQAGGHLVADHQRALGQPFQLRRGVDAVLGVVELLRPDHPQPVFEVAERVAGAEDVDPGRQLHRPRQPLVEVQPRLVPLGDLQRLHPADGEHGDVPLLAGHPVDQLDRRAVRGAVALDLLGQREQVAAFPLPVGRPARACSGGAMHSATER